MPEKYDFLIVGAGLFGATFARIATDNGYRCLVVERRAAVGGNIRCEKIEGINVHTYGAHIFHTSDTKVWEFANRFVRFNRYTNSPIACYRNRLYNLPFNMNTFCELWGCTTPEQALAKLESERKEALDRLNADGVAEPRNLEEQALSLVGRDIYEKLIKGYTEKQWGRPCASLPAFIIRRLPLRLTFDNNYFNDLYQGIPEGGYNQLIDRLLDGSKVICDCDYFERRDTLDRIADKILFTGKIDQFYDYRFGKLEYRTVKFENEILDTPNYQGVAVMNFTDNIPAWTRIIEHKHFESFGEQVYQNPRTVISREYPTEWRDGLEPFYPVNDTRNSDLYIKYKSLSEREKNVYFGGRLAEYKYYDMAPAMAHAIAMAQELAPRRL